LKRRKLAQHLNGRPTPKPHINVIRLSHMS